MANGSRPSSLVHWSRWRYGTRTTEVRLIPTQVPGWGSPFPSANSYRFPYPSSGPTLLLSSYHIPTLTLNPIDPIFISILTDIVKALAQVVYETVVQQALPRLVDTIRASTSAGSSDGSSEAWIAGSAIELVSSLVEACPPTGLGDGFFGLLAPALFECLDKAEDRDVLQVWHDPFLEAWPNAGCSCRTGYRA
jgi:hypothetical protein